MAKISFSKPKLGNKPKKKNYSLRHIKQNNRCFIQWRFYTTVFFVLLAITTLIGRAAYIQIIEPDRLVHEGNIRSIRVKSLASSRGIISDRNNTQLAVSVPVQAVIADPYDIFRKKGFYDNNGKLNLAPWYALADVLNLDREKLIARITKNKKRRFIYLQRQVSPAMANYVKSLKLSGIGLNNESRRFYPTGEISAQVIGVTGIEGNGLEGIEKTYDGWLTGEPGRRTVRKDRYGRVIENIAVKHKKPGQPVVLSIDQRIQTMAYLALKKAMLDNNATSATAILVDVKTGEILALANTPSYNSNDRKQLKSFRMRNRAITDSIEPGSTIKPFVILAALDNKTANLDTIVDTGNGVYRIGGSRVRDVSKVGKASLTKILQKSSNVGVSKLSLAMPVDDLLDLYRRVGLDSTSGINLIGETSGFFPNRMRWSDFERATLAFGYGISITPIQLAHAYATLGAMGVSRPLSLLKTEKIIPGKQIVKAKYAREVLNMLEAVTQKGGSATRAAVQGYRVGAKTGTSRKAVAGGYGDDYVALTAGIAPISDPRLALVVVINEPKGDKYYGGLVAAPVFKSIMRQALHLLNIAPDEKKL